MLVLITYYKPLLSLIFVIQEHDKYGVDIEYEIEDLLTQSWVETHPAFDKLKAIATQYL